MAARKKDEIFDKHCGDLIDDNINMTVPWYLMAAYAYYEEDDPILSDAFFDKLANKILKEWDNITHYHKHLLSKELLEAGSFLGEYPSIVKGALKNIKGK